jgi:hypothetical protein
MILHSVLEKENLWPTRLIPCIHFVVLRLVSGASFAGLELRQKLAVGELL